MLHAITNCMLPGDVVFDIGANSGEKSAWFLGKGVKIVCVEPQPQMIAQLRERFSSEPDVAIRAVGVGRRRERRTLHISTLEPTLSTFSEHWQQGRFVESQWDAAAEVDMVTLDDLVQEFGVPRYCKIDVEGYERDVIAGPTRRIGIISYEFTNEYMEHALEVLERLIQIGYKKFNFSVAEQENLYLPNWVNYYEIAAILHTSRNAAGLWGDIYAN